MLFGYWHCYHSKLSSFSSLSSPPCISFLYLSWSGWGWKSAQSASFVHCVSFPHVPLLPGKLNFHPLKIHLLCLDFTELKNRTFHQTVQLKIKLNCTSAQKMWQDKDLSNLKKIFLKTSLIVLIDTSTYPLRLKLVSDARTRHGTPKKTFSV